MNLLDARGNEVDNGDKVLIVPSGGWIEGTVEDFSGIIQRPPAGSEPGHPGVVTATVVVKFRLTVLAVPGGRVSNITLVEKAATPTPTSRLVDTGA